MKSIGTITVGLIAVGLAPVWGSAVAQAQTAVTRQITSEPVETVVTQGPNGTAVTRRILTPEPGVSTYVAPPLEYPPVAVQPLEPQYVEPAAPAVTTRRTTTSAAATVGVSTHTPVRTTRRTSARPVRPVTRTVAVPPPSDQALVLSPAQRQVIYRTVAQREYIPAPVPAGPPVVAQTEFYAPPLSRYDDPYRAAGYGDYAYRSDAYRDDDYRDPYHTAYRWDGVPLVVGVRIPPSLPLVTVPEPVAARIPVAAPYSYAVLDNRVYLVDPATDVIVAVVTP